MLSHLESLSELSIRCVRLVTFPGVMQIIVNISSGITLTLRVYALYGRALVWTILFIVRLSWVTEPVGPRCPSALINSRGWGWKCKNVILLSSLFISNNWFLTKWAVANGIPAEFPPGTGTCWVLIARIKNYNRYCRVCPYGKTWTVS